MLLAVYGTLRKGQYLGYLLENMREAGNSEVIELSGLTIHIVGTVPGAKITKNPKDKAVVELIETHISKWYEDKIIQALDAVEGVNDGLYEKNYIDTPKGKALIYTIVMDVSNHIQIYDWMKWIKIPLKKRLLAVRRAGQNQISIALR